eukprot:scaffold7898_cov239-Pinguiococcus_pyrenoidosus.AAC.1
MIRDPFLAEPEAVPKQRRGGQEGRYSSLQELRQPKGSSPGEEVANEGGIGASKEALDTVPVPDRLDRREHGPAARVRLDGGLDHVYRTERQARKAAAERSRREEARGLGQAQRRILAKRAGIAPKT